MWGWRFRAATRKSTTVQDLTQRRKGAKKTRKDIRGIAMTCEEFSEHVSDYIEGTIASGNRTAMDRHVTDCALCQQMLKDVQALTHRLAHLPGAQPSAEFDFALRSRILMETVAEKQWHRRIERLCFSSAQRTALSLAAAAALILGAAALLKPGPMSLPMPQTVSTYPRAGRAPSHQDAIDGGTLKMLSQEESYEISGRFYRTHPDTLKARPDTPRRDAVAPGVRRVTVRF